MLGSIGFLSTLLHVGGPFVHERRWWCIRSESWNTMQWNLDIASP